MLGRIVLRIVCLRTCILVAFIALETFERSGRIGVGPHAGLRDRSVAIALWHHVEEDTAAK